MLQFLFCFDKRFYYVAQIVLKLLGISNPIASASQLAGTTDLHHHAQLYTFFTQQFDFGKIILQKYWHTHEMMYMQTYSMHYYLSEQNCKPPKYTSLGN